MHNNLSGSVATQDAALERGRAALCPPSQPANVLSLSGQVNTEWHPSLAGGRAALCLPSSQPANLQIFLSLKASE